MRDARLIFSVVILLQIITSSTTLSSKIITACNHYQINSKISPTEVGIHGNCSIIQFYLHHQDDITPTLAKYSGRDNVYVFGMITLLGSQFVREIRNAGNTQFDQNFALFTAYSMEVTAAVLPISLKNFCQEERNFNFTFV